MQLHDRHGTWQREDGWVLGDDRFTVQARNRDIRESVAGEVVNDQIRRG